MVFITRRSAMKGVLGAAALTIVGSTVATAASSRGGIGFVVHQSGTLLTVKGPDGRIGDATLTGFPQGTQLLSGDKVYLRTGAQSVEAWPLVRMEHAAVVSASPKGLLRLSSMSQAIKERAGAFKDGHVKALSGSKRLSARLYYVDNRDAEKSGLIAAVQA